jgi:hypothetical protein
MSIMGNTCLSFIVVAEIVLLLLGPSTKASDDVRVETSYSSSAQIETNAQGEKLAQANSTAAVPGEHPTPSAAAASPKPTPSENVTVNLVHRMVDRGLLTPADAEDLIQQAEHDAEIARAQKANASTRSAAVNANSAALPAPDVPVAPGESPLETAAPPAVSSRVPDGEDEVRVTYVPEIVKQQLRDEIRQDVMEQAREENWANPRTFPAWALRITPFADFRMRYEGIFFPSGNDNTGAFPNFNAINTGPPFDVTGTTFSPQLNVDQNRNRIRLRLRVGAEMDLEDGLTFGVRIATGETNTPTSTNQTLGVANSAQGSNFSKYAIWLDRAFVRYEASGESANLVAYLGRFDNPFFAPTELVWDEDLGWDGFAVTGRYQVLPGVKPFLTVGAFPVFNTELNFSSNRPSKFPSEDRWLLAAQSGATLRLNHDFSATLAAGFYDFLDIEGKLSSPFVPLTTSDQGNTDDTRPAFAQNGNTYFPIRNIIPTIDNNFGTTKQFQYFGLATPFRELDLVGTLDYAHWDPFHLTLFGEFVDNVAFNFGDVNAKAINNRGPSLSSGNPGAFQGGNFAWMVGLKAGAPALQKPWDWNVGISYRYIESDATVDAFNDSDFGLGGTNLKGYTLFGSLALTKHASIFLRWMSADEVGGPPFRRDILQFDFNAKF